MANRYFLAIEPSPEAVAEIQRIQTHLEGSSQGVYRPTARETLHVTLYFCGDTDPSDMERIGDSLAGLGSAGFDLALDGIKLLPQPDVPRVVAAGVSSAGRELAAFQQRVHDVCFPVATHKEVRPFAPHITLARLGKDVPARAKVVKRALAGLGELRPVVWRAAELVVFSSAPGPAGPEYAAVRRIALV